MDWVSIGIKGRQLAGITICLYFKKKWLGVGEVNPGRGKQKGSGFERSICRKLSLWISKGKNPNVFWRSALSGGRSTVQLKKGVVNTVQCGDITAVSPEGFKFAEEYYVELKHYDNLRIVGSLLNNTGELSRFWFDTQEKAKKYNKYPILIAKEDYVKTMLWCNAQFMFAKKPDEYKLSVPLWNAFCYLFDEVITFPEERVRIV